MRIGVVAPSTPIDEEVAARVTDFAAARFPSVTLDFHPQCFLRHNHFAGTDDVRAGAFLDVANDTSFDALWFARGGYGSCRIAETVLSQLSSSAADKHYLGYSDAGFLLAGLYQAGFRRLSHGPMPHDVKREGGEAAIARSLAWMAEAAPEALEPNAADLAAVAFNLTVFSQLIGTPLQPDLSGQVLMLEEVGEYMYRIDRSMFHITSNFGVRSVAGIRIGRCSLVPGNDPDFGETEEDVVRYWCGRSGIEFLGRADIGHDAENKVVPFGNFAAGA